MGINNKIEPFFVLEAVEACLEDYGDSDMAEKLLVNAINNYQSSDKTTSFWFWRFGDIAYEKLKNTELAQAAYLKAMKNARNSFDMCLVLNSSFRSIISHELFMKFLDLAIARADTEKDAMTLACFTILAHKKLHDRKLAYRIFTKGISIAQLCVKDFDNTFFSKGFDEFLLLSGSIGPEIDEYKS